MHRIPLPAARALAAACALALALAAARADAPKPPSMDEALVAHLAEAKWAAPKAPEFPAGAMAAPVAVDPQSGASLGWGRFPGGAALPAHWHSHAEYTVLVAGKATFTLEGKAHQLLAGSYASIPAKAVHSLICAAGADCVVFTRRAGPTDYHWVK